MAWTVNYTETALRQLRKFDKATARRIIDFMDSRVATLSEPRSLGSALRGAALGAFWRYRVGDYRIICDVQDDALCILVIETGHRKESYR